MVSRLIDEAGPPLDSMEICCRRDSLISLKGGPVSQTLAGRFPFFKHSIGAGKLLLDARASSFRVALLPFQFLNPLHKPHRYTLHQLQGIHDLGI